MRFPIVLFDLNGTLVDTLSDLTAALNDTLAQLGRPLLEEAQARAWSGEGLRGLLRAALLATGPAPTDLEINEWLHDFRARYAAHLGERARVYPGVVETLKALAQAGVQMAIVTNKPEAPSLGLLAQMEIAEYFEYFMTCDGAIPRKPDPTGTLRLMAKMCGTATGTLMVGSSRIDRETAHNAGITCALVQHGDQESARVRGLGADFVLDDFAKLKALVLGPQA
jgi:phosphoglycolate phosphatase